MTMAEPHIDWLTELQNESRREQENPGIGLCQIMTLALTDYEALAPRLERGLAWICDRYQARPR
jgi:hypothetical protein